MARGMEWCLVYGAEADTAALAETACTEVRQRVLREGQGNVVHVEIHTA